MTKPNISGILNNEERIKTLEALLPVLINNLRILNTDSSTARLELQLHHLKLEYKERRGFEYQETLGYDA